MDRWSLKDILIKNLEIVQEETQLDLSAEIDDILEADGQILGILTRLTNRIQVRPNELLDPYFKFSYGKPPPPTCS